MSDEFAPEPALERDLVRWLHAAVPVPPPDLADRILRRTRATPQQRWWIGWFAVLPAAGALGALVLAVVVGLQLGGLLSRPEVPIGADGPASDAPFVVGPLSDSGQPSPGPSDDGLASMRRCRNEVDGYTVRYPAEWYANPSILPGDGLDGVAACRFFAPTEFEVLPNAGLPPTVAISFQRIDQQPPPAGTVLRDEQVIIDGWTANVRELETTEGFFLPAGSRIYEYLVPFDDGDLLLVGTDSARDGDYDEHGACLT